MDFKWCDAYLLDAIFVTFFKCQDFVCTLLSVVNLFPSLLLLLFEKGDSIGQKLGVTLNAEHGKQSKVVSCFYFP